MEWQEIFKVLQGGSSIKSYSKESLREKFDAIDIDGSGELDENEMRLLFESLGRPVSKRITANVMRLTDSVRYVTLRSCFWFVILRAQTIFLCTSFSPVLLFLIM